MRIMTANIWGDYFNNPVDIRENGISGTIKKYSPDIVGMQEITDGWYDSELFSNLSEIYTLVEGIKGNFTPLLYKTNRFCLLERGWELYADTPDLSKSITWAVLCEVDTKKSIAVCNTHLWWKSNGMEDDVLRLKNAEQLLKLVRHIKEQYRIPVFAFGDFNCVKGSMALEYFENNNFIPAYKFAERMTDVCSHHGDPILGDDGCYHGEKTQKKIHESLDYVLTFPENVDVRNYIVIEDREILDSTDHSPVYTDVEF